MHKIECSLLDGTHGVGALRERGRRLCETVSQRDRLLAAQTPIVAAVAGIISALT